MKQQRSMENKCVGLISAVPSEGSLFLEKLGEISTYPRRQPLFYRGRVGEREIVYSISGMGKTNAAHAATLLIRDYSPEVLINFGVGGAYPSAGLTVGDVMVAEAEIYGEEGVRDRDGFHGTEYMGIPVLRKGKKKYYNEFAFEKKRAEAAVRSARRAFDGLEDAPKVKSGKFVTVSTCTGTLKRAVELEKMWGAICENMEGASIAHICALYKIPLIEIRGVSNIVEDRDKAKWNLELASENCSKALIQLLKEIKIY